jgi:phosphoribosylformylglycinamidine cyclo-ligase
MRHGGIILDNQDDLNPITYKDSGVDLDAAGEAIKLIKKPVFSTFNKNVLNDLTSYAGLFLFEKDKFKEPVLVSSTDGVGTKLLLARTTGLLDNIGQDLVAMCINDILCCGATPLFFLDYIACGKLEPQKIETIVKSIASSCKICETALIGGEIAEMPDMYGHGDIDLAGFVVGAVDRQQVIKPDLVKEGDIVLGVASSGIHSNGYSLVREIIREKKLSLAMDYKFIAANLSGRNLGEILMEPTKLYFKVSKNFKDKHIKINGMAHITGGGFYENINRVIPDSVDAQIRQGSWEIPEIFKFLQIKGNMGNDEMFRVFNMGIGMVYIISPEYAKKAITSAEEAGEIAFNIGQIVKGSGKVSII